MENNSLSKAEKRAMMNSSNTDAIKTKFISRVTTYLTGNGTSSSVDLSTANTAERVVKIDKYSIKLNIK